MARISTYVKDSQVTIDDKLLGSSYEGEGIGGPIFETRNFKVKDLVAFFSRVREQYDEIYDLAAFLDDLNKLKTNYTYDENGNLTGLSQAGVLLVTNSDVSDSYATASFEANVTAKVVQFNENGDISLISEGFANTLMTTTTTDRFAESQFVNNLGASFGTLGEDGSITTFSSEYLDTVTAYADANSATASKVTELNSALNILDENGNATVTNAEYLESITTYVDENSASSEKLTQLTSAIGSLDTDGNLTLSESFANQVLNTETTTDYAQAQFVTNLASSLGTTDANGNLTVSESFANQVLNTETTTDYADASFVTNLAASLGTTDANGNLTVSEAFANSVLNTETTTDYADASFVTNLAASLGTTDADGNLTISEAFANSVLNTETTTDYAEASFVTNLASSLGTTDVNGNLTVSEAFANSVLNTETTTDYADASFVTNLASSLGTTDANGNLTVSEAFANSVLNTETTTDYAESSFVTNLASSLGTTDADGNLTISEAFANSVMSTETTTDYASAQSVSDLVVVVGADDQSGLRASVSEAQGAIADLEGHAEANYSIVVDVNGNVAGMKLLADTTTSEIAFTADTFKIYNGTNATAAFTLDGSALKLNVPLNGVTGSFTGDITGASGTFGGTVSGATVVGGVISVPTNDSDRKFYVDSQGSVYISDQSAGTPGLNIRDDSNGSTGVTIASDKIFTAAGVEVYLTPFSSQTSSAYLKWGNIATITTGTGNKLLINAADAKFSGNVEIVGDLTVTGSSSSHPNITGAADVNNIGQTVIQSLDFDTFGHVVGTGSVSIAYPAIINNAGTPELPTGVTGAEIRGLIGAGTSSFSGAYDDLTGKPTLFDGDYDSLSNKPTIYAEPGIFSGGGTPTLASGVTGAEIITLIGAATSGHLHDTRYLRKDIDVAMNSGKTITATDFILASDQRLKHDINTYTPQPINIRYRDYLVDGSDRRRVGVIAQELERDHPDFVITNPETGYKAVSYVDMLMAKIAELEDRINQLENGGS